MKKPHITKGESKLGQALARDLEDTFDRRHELAFDDLVEAFRAVENKHLAEFDTTNQFLVLETKRRVAEMTFKAATTTCCPLETCRAQLDNLFRLGFTNLERKVTMCIFFARYCQETGLAQPGIDLLEPVEAELQAELKLPGITRREREFYRTLLGQTQVVLSELRASSNPRQS